MSQLIDKILSCLGEFRITRTFTMTRFMFHWAKKLIVTKVHSHPRRSQRATFWVRDEPLELAQGMRSCLCRWPTQVRTPARLETNRKPEEDKIKLGGLDGRDQSRSRSRSRTSFVSRLTFENRRDYPSRRDWHFFDVGSRVLIEISTKIEKSRFLE